MFKHVEIALVIWLLAGVALLLAPSTTHAQTVTIQNLMFEDPELKPPSMQYTVSKKLMPLWTKGLEQGDRELKCQIAGSMLIAQRLGITKFGDTVAAVRRQFSSPEATLAVRLSMAKTLVTFDDRASADALFARLEKDGLAMALIAEPALARWRYKPMVNVWLGRLENAALASPTKLKLALSGLRISGEQRAAKTLQKMVHNANLRDSLRVEAARVWGELVKEGLEGDARQLVGGESKSDIDELAAVLLLRHHSGDKAITWLKTRGHSRNTALATIALQRLLELKPEFVLEMIENVIASTDASIRRIGAHALIARPSEEHIVLLGRMLNDPHPDIRSHTRIALVGIAQETNRRKAVVSRAMEVLRADQWAALEQAIILLADLDVKESSTRLVELLDHSRSEVQVAAAWGLRRLRIADTIPALARKAEQLEETTRLAVPLSKEQLRTSAQLTHVFEALSVMGYKPVEPLLRRFIGKRSPYSKECRSAAIWALGTLYANNAETDLVDLFTDRFDDINSTVPEYDMVRRQSAIALGHMKAAKAVSSLEANYSVATAFEQVDLAAGWALAEIQNTEFKVIEVQYQQRSSWALVPLE